MSGKLWNNRDERTRWINERIDTEARVHLGNSLIDFGDRVQNRCREDMKAAGISSIIIWWIVKFIVIQLVEYFFFSPAADSIRLAELQEQEK